MENLIIFLVKFTALLLLFFSTYCFILKKNTFFTSNRWFLLFGLFCAGILPLISFQKIVWIEPIVAVDTSNFQVITSNESTVSTLIAQNQFIFSWEMIVGIIYAMGVLFFLGQLLIEFYSLRKIIRNKSTIKVEGVELIEIDEVIAPFSFFKKIVYNRNLFQPEELHNIVEHEKIHAKQLHSLDVLIARMYCIIFWWNPAIWFYKKAIIQNLEFIADKNALAKAINKKSYLHTLLKITTAEKHVAITNHFYQSLIKKRIVMLHTNQSKKHHSWSYLLVFPALIFFMVSYQVEVVAQEKPVEEIAKKQTEELIKKNQIEKKLSENKKNQKTIDSLITETAIAEQILTSSTNTKAEFKILVTSNDKFLNEQADYFKKEYGISVDFGEISRNKAGKITAITITLKNNAGKTEVYNASGNEGIKPFSIFTKIDSDKNQTFGFSASSDNQHLKNHFEALERNKKRSEKNIYLKNRKVLVEEIEKRPEDVLFVLNGTVISNEVYQKIDPNTIKSVAVIKRKKNDDQKYEEFFTKYNERAKNGIISIITEEIQKPIKKHYNGSGTEYKTSSPENNIDDIIENKEVDYKESLIVLNGKEISRADMEKVDPTTIVKVNVIKDVNNAQFIKMYGEKARNGIIIIETR